MKLKSLIFLNLLLTTTCFASEETTEENVVTTSGFYLSYGQISIDKATDVVKYGEIGDSADHVKLGWEQHNNEWVWGLGLSFFLYDDNNKFSQRTRDNFGNEQNSKSSATAFNGYIEGGYKYNFNENTHAIALIGYEQVFSSERSIGNCSNCASQDLDVDGGLYIQPRITYQWDNNWFAALSHQLYLSGDVSNSAFLTVGVNY